MDQTLNYLAERIGVPSFLIGIVFIIAALILYFFPPKKINYLYGYRTRSSIKNQQVWDFSQKYSAVKMLQLGLFLIVVSLLHIFIPISQDHTTFIEIGLVILGCIYMFVTTEKALKKNFLNEK